MKKHRIVQCLSVALALILTASGPLSIFAGASDAYRERKPDEQEPSAPQWVQTEVSCKSGGNTLRGTLTVPKEHNSKIPVAILLHGLNTDRSWCDDIAWKLADNGIASVRFDFDGNGNSSGTQENMTIASEVQDTTAILDYVQGLAFTDTDNILLVGKSMGGVIATLAAQERGSEIKAICLWYPGFGIADGARWGYLMGVSFDPRNPPETIEASGYTYGREFIRQAQSLDIRKACTAYSGPVLILHGDQDSVAPITYSFDAASAFSDCTVNVVPGGSHGFSGFQELKALDDMLTFFQSSIT